MWTSIAFCVGLAKTWLKEVDRFPHLLFSTFLPGDHGKDTTTTNYGNILTRGRGLADVLPRGDGADAVGSGDGHSHPVQAHGRKQTLSPAFRIDSNVGVEAVAAPEIGVTVANGMITVCGCENPAIEVYSTDGILLRRVNAASLDATTLGSGIYLVSVTDGAKRAVRKVRI